MKVNDNPFPRDQNMVDARLLKRKTKVLISTDPEKLEPSIPRCKYQLMNIERSKGIVMNIRADMSRERHQGMGQ